MNTQRLRKQRGAISLLGAGAIALSLTAASQMIAYGNAKLLDRELDNYARDVATVALRSELAITKGMTNKGITNETIEKVLGAVGQTLPNPKDEKAAFSLEKKITFGNIVEGKFVPLKNYPENPKASDDFIEFSAVAVELWSKSGGFPSISPVYIPSGKAIYGLSESDVDSPDIAACFCDKRYEMCMVSGMSGVPVSFTGSVGSVGSPARQNYCEYGHVDSHPANIDKTKYPSVSLGSQWLGKDVLEDGTKLIDFGNATQVANYKIVANQEPLEVIKGVDPFSKQRWNFWLMSWFTGNDGYYAKDWKGVDLKDDNSYLEGKKSSYEITEGGWFSSKYVLVDGFFYVGRKGTCVKGTDSGDVPNISGGLKDITNVATSTSSQEVMRCLSYEKKIGSITTQEVCNMMEMFSNPDCWGDGKKTVKKDVNGYAQQSCIDFNSNDKTRMNFFQWMMSLFFGPFTSMETSYTQLDCSVKKMRYFSIKLPFLGDGFTWQIP